LEFGRRHVPFNDWNAITLNQNYAASPHRDRGNEGLSYLVAFGEFQGGRLQIHEPDLSGCYDIRGQPIIFDGSRILHSVEQFTGDRYSLVYYRLSKAPAKKLEQYEPTQLPKRWVLIYTDEEGKETVLKRGKGLPHPLSGRKKA